MNRSITAAPAAINAARGTDRAEDPDQQNTLAVAEGDGELGQDDGEDEQVIYRQDLLD